jgi:hypothetical protein
MKQLHRSDVPRCSACRGNYEDPGVPADESEDSVEETEETVE